MCTGVAHTTRRGREREEGEKENLRLHFASLELPSFRAAARRLSYRLLPARKTVSLETSRPVGRSAIPVRLRSGKKTTFIPPAQRVALSAYNPPFQNERRDDDDDASRRRRRRSRLILSHRRAAPHRSRTIRLEHNLPVFFVLFCFIIFFNRRYTDARTRSYFFLSSTLSVVEDVHLHSRHRQKCALRAR